METATTQHINGHTLTRRITHSNFVDAATRTDFACPCTPNIGDLRGWLFQSMRIHNTVGPVVRWAKPIVDQEIDLFNQQPITGHEALAILLDHIGYPEHLAEGELTLAGFITVTPDYLWDLIPTLARAFCDTAGSSRTPTQR